MLCPWKLCGVACRFLDELAWAAAWLYVATNQASYLADAGRYYSQWYQVRSLATAQCPLILTYLAVQLPGSCRAGDNPMCSRHVSPTTFCV